MGAAATSAVRRTCESLPSKLSSLNPLSRGSTIPREPNSRPRQPCVRVCSSRSKDDSRPLTTLVGDKPQYSLRTAVTSPPTDLLQGRTLRSANLRHTVLANASLSVRKVQQRDRLLLPISNSTSNI